jgi:gamma-tubulin complex component 3
LYLWI